MESHGHVSISEASTKNLSISRSLPWMGRLNPAMDIYPFVDVLSIEHGYVPWPW